ncbi:hypothetical protein MT416_06310 [Mammaliicoccus sciuri]|uniref:hypothetical protein n=1 Tax=Mammaliicoccus sciuri TaxID=1296 RepID=UPI00132FD43B|nr:hypothetical protein [Mammaliicoccus sciuri]MCJ1748917.1 hypothetical protein [Mammaliicoccus sciuri]
MNKKLFVLSIIGSGDYHFNKSDFKNIKITSNDDFNFNNYKDAVDFIDSINSTNEYSDICLSAHYLITEFDTYPEKIHKEGTINIPAKFLNERVIKHYDYMKKIEKKDLEKPEYVLNEGEEFYQHESE